MNMVNFILMEEVDDIIPEVEKTLGSDYSGSYDEEIILEGSQVDMLRISQRPMEVEEIVSVRDRELLYLFVVRTLLKVHYLSI